jgi:hypothetical protein
MQAGEGVQVGAVLGVEASTGRGRVVCAEDSGAGLLDESAEGFFLVLQGAGV